MYVKFKKFWKEYKFEIVLGGTILFIIIFALFRIGKKGTFSSTTSGVVTEKKKPPRVSKGETECKRVLESIFNVKFEKDRPDFLRNPVTSGGNTGINLELDCFNKELSLAVEYNGIQHYKFVPYFHKTKETFQNQKYRDYMKRDLCEKNGVTLIEVPYTIRVENIEDHLVEKLISLNIIKRK